MPATKATTDKPKADAPVVDGELDALLQQIESDPMTRRSLPDILEHGDVISAKAAAGDMQQKRAAVAAEISALETRLGLKAGASRSLEPIAGELIAKGRATDDDIETAGRLWVRLKRLTDAEAMATDSLHKAIARARLELSPLAAEVRYLPASRATSAALVELLRCLRVELDAAHELRTGNFQCPRGSGLDADGILDLWSNPIVVAMVESGLVDREAVKLAAPHMQGV